MQNKALIQQFISKTMGRSHGALFIILTSASLLSISPANAWLTSANQYMPGYTVAQVNGVSLFECQSQCESRQDCLAYSWADRSLARRQSICELKENLAPLVASQNFTTSIRDANLQRVGYDLPGNIYRQLLSPDAAHCLSQCLGDAECKAYTWTDQTFEGTRQCLLKNSHGDFTSNQNCVSGVIPRMARVLAAGPPQVLSGNRHVFLLGANESQDPVRASTFTNLAQTFSRRGHQVHRISNVSSAENFAQIRRQIERANPGRSQVIVTFLGHGTEAFDTRGRDHRINLNNGYLDDREFLTAGQLRQLDQLARRRRIRFAVIDNSCHGGNTVVSLNGTNHACAMARSTPRTLTYTDENDVVARLLANPTNRVLSDIANGYNARPPHGPDVQVSDALYQTGCARPWMALREALDNDAANFGGRDDDTDTNRFYRGDFSLLEDTQSSHQQECLTSDFRSLVASNFLRNLHGIENYLHEQTFARIYPPILEQFRANPSPHRPVLPEGLTSYAALVSGIQSQIAQLSQLWHQQESEVTAFNFTATNNHGRILELRMQIISTQQAMNQVLMRLEPMISIAQAVDCASRDTPCSQIEL